MRPVPLFAVFSVGACPSRLPRRPGYIPPFELPSLASLWVDDQVDGGLLVKGPGAGTRAAEKKNSGDESQCREQGDPSVVRFNGDLLLKGGNRWQTGA